MYLKRVISLLICLVTAFGMCMPVMAVLSDSVIDIMLDHVSYATMALTASVGDTVAVKDLVPADITHNSRKYALEYVMIDPAGATPPTTFTAAQVSGGATYKFETDDTHEIVANYLLVPTGGGSSRSGNKTQYPISVGVGGIDWEKGLKVGRTYRFFTLPDYVRLDFDQRYFERGGPGAGFAYSDEDGYFSITPSRSGKTRLKFRTRGFLDREIDVTIED